MRHKAFFSRREVLYCGAALIVGVADAFSDSHLVDQALTVSKDRPYWHFCNKCQVMFSTEAEKNVCAAGGQHLQQGYDFRLPFDVPGTANAQTNWRCCRYCQTMFYNGYPNKGRCPAGEGHLAQGYNFVLPHVRPR